MMKLFAGFGIALFLASTAFAAMPGNYGAVTYDEALANAKRDNRPIMIYFGEDW